MASPLNTWPVAAWAAKIAQPAAVQIRVLLMVRPALLRLVAPPLASKLPPVSIFPATCRSAPVAAGVVLIPTLLFRLSTANTAEEVEFWTTRAASELAVKLAGPVTVSLAPLSR